MAKDKTESLIPNTIYIAEEEGYSYAKDQPFISGLLSIDKQRANMDEMMKRVHSIMYILILASLVLSVVILYNLGFLHL